MLEPSSKQPDQSLNISGSVLESVQIGGIAGRDLTLTQIQGGVGSINVFGSVQVAQADISAAKPISHQEYRWRTVLLDKVRKFWIEGVLEKSLHTKILIELGLEERQEFVQNPLSGVEEFPFDSKKAFSEGATVTNIFEGIGAGRTLLILGEPGAGKTVTLLKLAESLLIRTENDVSQPLPVVLNLSSWVNKRKSISNWVIQELSEIYKVSKSLVKEWVEQEQLILLLDGLDEVDTKYRNDCVKALNQFLYERGLTELVVCCRIQDYDNLSERLKLRSAIYVQPLTPYQINHFLEQAGEPLCALKIMLQASADLKAFASSPLILSIMSLSYQGFSAEMLSKAETLEDLRKQLFNTYIERMFMRRGTTQQYPKEQMMHWLNRLAQQMEEKSKTIFLIEDLQPSCLALQEHLSYRIESAFASVPILALMFFPSNGLSSWADSISSVTEAIFLASFVIFLGDIKTVERLKWSWREGIRNSRNAATFFLLVRQFLV